MILLFIALYIGIIIIYFLERKHVNNNYRLTKIDIGLRKTNIAFAVLLIINTIMLIIWL